MPLVQVLIAFGLIMINAGFVLAEFSLVKVRASYLELLARRGNPRAVMVQGMLQNLDVYLSTIQFGITITSLCLGWIGEPAVAGIIEPHLQHIPFLHEAWIIHGLSFLLALGAIAVSHMVLGELVPRSIGIQKAEAIALWTALPLRIFYSLFKKPVTGLANVSIGILRLLRLKPVSEADAQVSEEELRIILGTSEDKSGFSLERLLFMENIFDFGRAKVADAMIPKEKVAVVSLAAGWEDTAALLRSRRYSRYPLCRTDLDTAIGFVHIRDLVLQDGAAADLPALRRNLKEVSVSDPLPKVLQQFTAQGTHMALVRDAAGRAAGILCLEDILEEIVGDIRDEFDLQNAWSLMDVLIPSAVETNMDVPDREGVLRELLGKLKAAHPALDLKEAMAAALEREAKFSGGAGHGVALPHARLSNLDRPLVAIGRAAKTFPYSAPDKIPVRLVFLILTPSSSPTIQLKILSRIASLVSNENLRRRLLRAKGPEQLVAILKTADLVLAA